jgi:hypothetical protein
VDSAGGIPARPTNDDVAWDTFDSEAYFQHNYGHLLPEDAAIIRIVADHFHNWAPRQWRTNAIDVGSGTNLYPALTMLPFVGRVTLYERAHTNREWLIHQLRRPAESWHTFWDQLQGRSEYDRIAKPFEQLSSRAEVEKGNLFNLEQDSYDLGTMFFVAESISTRMEEFERAIKRFIGSLTSGAPFAATFMRDSSGYEVGSQWFPACSINEDDVRRCLTRIAQIDGIDTIDSHDLRDGYNGMIVATGRALTR